MNAFAMLKRDQASAPAPAQCGASERARLPAGKPGAGGDADPAEALAQARAWAAQMQASRRELIAEVEALKSERAAALDRIEDLRSSVWSLLCEIGHAIEADDYPAEKVTEAIEKADQLFDAEGERILATGKG